MDEAGFNGKYEDGEVYLSVQGDRDLPYIFSHEITHHMQDFAPVEYNELKELVRQAWAEKGGIDEAVNDKIAQYAEKDVQLTYEDALDEIIADSTYEMIQDEGFAEHSGCYQECAIQAPTDSGGRRRIYSGAERRSSVPTGYLEKRREAVDGWSSQGSREPGRGRREKKRQGKLFSQTVRRWAEIRRDRR